MWGATPIFKGLKIKPKMIVYLYMVKKCPIKFKKLRQGEGS